jgi:hypothetical protein
MLLLLRVFGFLFDTPASYNLTKRNNKKMMLRTIQRATRAYRLLGWAYIE